MNKGLGFVASSRTDTGRASFIGTPGFPSKRGVIGGLPRQEVARFAPASFPSVLDASQPSPSRRAGESGAETGAETVAALRAKLASLQEEVGALRTSLLEGEGCFGTIWGTVLQESRMLVETTQNAAALRASIASGGERAADERPLAKGSGICLYYPMVREKGEGGGVFMRCRVVHSVTGQPTMGWTCVFSQKGVAEEEWVRYVGNFSDAARS